MYEYNTYAHTYMHKNTVSDRNGEVHYTCICSERLGIAHARASHIYRHKKIPAIS